MIYVFIHHPIYRYMDFFYCFTFTMISFESGLIRAVNSSYISAAWIRFWLVDQSSWPAGMRLTLNACELVGICYATIWFIALFRCIVICIWNKNKQQNLPNCTKAIHWFTTCILGPAVYMSWRVNINMVPMVVFFLLVLRLRIWPRTKLGSPWLVSLWLVTCQPGLYSAFFLGGMRGWMVIHSVFLLVPVTDLAKNFFIILVRNRWKPCWESVLHNIMDISCQFKTQL